jgi:hypothetical protein
MKTPALLRYNSSAIKFTFLKYVIQRFSAYPPSPSNFKTFSPPQEKPH